MDNIKSSVGKFKKVELKPTPQFEFHESTATKVPVINVQLAYDVCTSPEEEPTLMYTPVIIEGYTDGHGNIQFPENDVIWEQIDKALILRHRLKRFNMAKSHFRILCSDGRMGPEHDFGDMVTCHTTENAYYLVNINQFVTERVNGSFVRPDDGKNKGEILINYHCIITSTGDSYDGAVTIRSSRLDKRDIMNALAKDLIENGLRDDTCNHVEFRTVVDDGEVSGVVAYSGMHHINFDKDCCQYDRKYYNGEDELLVDLGYASITEFFQLYNEETEWYQMI